MRLFAWIVVCVLSAAVAAGQAQRNYKDRAEYDLYNEIGKDFSANNFSKALADLDQWSQKYPDSEFKEDREMLYVQAYSSANQPGKVLDVAAVALADDRFGSANSANLLRVLYAAVSAIQRVPDPTPQQLAAAEKAAHKLETYDTAPDGVTAAAWAATRADLKLAASSGLLYIAVAPASRAVRANDCSGAEAAAMQAIQAFPESIQAAWFLALADVCLAKSDPAKASVALYELARAASLDPAKGMADGKWQQANVVPYLEKVYAQFHGADPQGLNELKQLASQSPLPPSGFAVQSTAEIAREKEADFETKNPELALWKKIRDALSATDGEHYFESELKGSAVPELQGILVEARPICRPVELQVAIHLPNDTQDQREDVVLKLEKPLTGKPDTGSEFHWTGVATAFSKEPFLLTMDLDPSDVKGLALSPCQPHPKRAR